jgi:hypothetical protein
MLRLAYVTRNPGPVTSLANRLPCLRLARRDWDCMGPIGDTGESKLIHEAERASEAHPEHSPMLCNGDTEASPLERTQHPIFLTCGRRHGPVPACCRGHTTPHRRKRRRTATHPGSQVCSELPSCMRSRTRLNVHRRALPEDPVVGHACHPVVDVLFNALGDLVSAGLAL